MLINTKTKTTNDMAKKIKIKKTIFTFWRENKKANDYQLSIDELQSLYRAWLTTKDLEWIEYYGHQTVAAFITANDGLNSTFDQNDYDDLCDQLMDVRHVFKRLNND